MRVRCEQAVSGGHEIVERSLKVGLAEAESIIDRILIGTSYEVPSVFESILSSQ